MKHNLSLLIIIGGLLVAACSKVHVKKGTPNCVKSKIRKGQNDCLNRVVSYDYNSETVYLFVPNCPDYMIELIDDKGKYLCAPSGGFSGKGDGLCPDFHSIATEKEVIWEK